MCVEQKKEMESDEKTSKEGNLSFPERKEKKDKKVPLQ